MHIIFYVCVSRYSCLTGIRTRWARKDQTAERSGLLSRQVAAGCPTRGGAQKMNRDTPGHRNAIASLAIKLLPSETTSRHLPRWKPVPRGIKFESSSAGNIIRLAVRTILAMIPGASLDYICSFSHFFLLSIIQSKNGCFFH